MTHFIQDLQKKARDDWYESDAHKRVDALESTHIARGGAEYKGKETIPEILDRTIHDTALATLEEVEKQNAGRIDLPILQAADNAAYINGWNAATKSMDATLSQLKEAITSNQQSV